MFSSSLRLLLALLLLACVTNSSPLPPSLEKRGTFTSDPNTAVFSCGFPVGGVSSDIELAAWDWAAKIALALYKQPVAFRTLSWFTIERRIKPAVGGSAEAFALGASSIVRVFEGSLSGTTNGLWKQKIKPALETNIAVTELRSINPTDGSEKILWQRIGGKITRYTTVPTGTPTWSSVDPAQQGKVAPVPPPAPPVGPTNPQLPRPQQGAPVVASTPRTGSTSPVLAPL